MEQRLQALQDGDVLVGASERNLPFSGSTTTGGLPYDSGVVLSNSWSIPLLNLPEVSDNVQGLRHGGQMFPKGTWESRLFPVVGLGLTSLQSQQLKIGSELGAPQQAAGVLPGRHRQKKKGVFCPGVKNTGTGNIKGALMF